MKFERISNEVKPCGVDWRLIRVKPITTKLVCYGRILRACQERYDQQQEEGETRCEDERQN